jgi:hypothetical protein
MLETNGIPPRLTGHECEELICQQFWQQGKLVKELDVLFIKAHGKWHQLYFEDNIVFWRSPVEPPDSYQEQNRDVFRYPLIDLGVKYGLKGQLIESCETEPMVDGAKVRLLFESGDKVVCVSVDNETRIQHIKG